MRKLQSSGSSQVINTVSQTNEDKLAHKILKMNHEAKKNKGKMEKK